jgi:hypothetical protein
MITFNERYLVDAQGQQLGVFLDLADYQKLRGAWEDLEAIRAGATAPKTRPLVKDFLDQVLTDHRPITLTVEQQLLVAVVPRSKVELIEQLQRCLVKFGVKPSLCEEPVSCYDDLEMAALSIATHSVIAQPTLIDVLDQVVLQKQPQLVNYQNQLFLVVVPLAEEALLEALEDCIDNANADEALTEEGSISLDDLIGELGLCVTP